jgi:diguanylate cyclase (GGDEF)-like protein/PAS domain S-box-containing protein
MGERADIIGGALTAWPVFFILWQEIRLEGIANFSILEMVAYGLPVLTLPIVGWLIRQVVLSRKRLVAARSYLRSIIDHLGDPLMIIDRDMRIVLANPTFEAYFGPVDGRTCREIFGGEESCQDLCAAPECLSGGKTSRFRLRRPVADGERWFEVTQSPFRDGDGEIVGLVEILRDVDHQVQMEEKLRQQAMTDGLTHLANARTFFQTFPQEVKRALRQGYPLSLVMLDVDNFKQYNDRLGHLAGDRVLRRLGEIIVEQIRQGVDAGYRYGGDEFAIALPHLTGEEASKVIERISEAFMAEAFPYVSLSAGVLLARTGMSVEEMVEQVDQAMYRSKRAGGNRVSIQEP